ncbi:MAG: hypothetical protein ACRDN9_21835 [Streptosporangiaceae bacterium]
MAIAELQARVHRMQGTRAGRRPLETLPALAGLVPGGLSAGAAYSVTGSATLAMALMAGPSAAGQWCGVVGVPEFGAEAAAATGVELARTILVPDPGDAWLGVTSTLVDVLSVIVVRPATRVYDAEASRLAARLRQRGTTLVALGDWPRAEARLAVTDSTWVGVGDGHGHLRGRQVTVGVTGRSGRPHRSRLWLPAPDAQIRAVEPVASPDVGAGEGMAS